jgi:hypothetical protein
MKTENLRMKNTKRKSCHSRDRIIALVGEGGFAFLRKSHGGCDSPPDCRQEPPFESTFLNAQTQKDEPSERMSRLSGGGRWIRRQLSVAKIAYIVEMSPSFPEKAQDVVREIYFFYNVVFYNG